MDVTTVDTSELRRVTALLQPPPGTTLTMHEALARKRQFAQAFPRVVAKMRRQAGLLPVTVDGSRARGLRAGWFKVRLQDGTWGYLQRRVDDCLQAAIASTLKIPPCQVPDLRLDEQLAAGRDPEQVERIALGALAAWVDNVGITIRFHPVPPTNAKRWIGVAPTTTGEPFSDHCLIMSGSTCLFDPSVILPLNKDAPGFLADPSHIEYGITIER